MVSGKRRLWLRAIVILFVIGAGWTGYIQWLIHTSEKPGDIEPREVGIVLGAALWDDRPSPALRERLDHAAALYRDGRVRQLIVTGGLDRNGSTIPEAEGMADYLIRQGIPESVLLVEPEATSTYENLLFSRSIMRDQGWRRALIVTHGYHGARALDIAAFLGYESPAVSLMESQVMWMPWHKARETLAYTKWLADKWRMRLFE